MIPRPRRRRSRGLAFLVALAAIGSAGPGGDVAHAEAARADAAPPVALPRLFPQQAEVTAPAGRLCRLDLPPAVIAACRPDLSDLRLFDAAGRETPWLVDVGASPENVTDLVQRATLQVIDVARREIRRESGPPLRRETLTVVLPAEAPLTGSWALLFDSRAAEFVARVTVEHLGDDGAATALLPDGSIFRLPAMHGAERLRLLLPADAGRRLRIVLESEHPFWIEPTLRIESARRLERAGRIAVPLSILSMRSGDGRTVVDLARPPGIVPDLLRVETTTPVFDRPIEASDEGPTGSGRLGSGRLFRVTGLVPTGEQEIGLTRASGERLRVTFEDGDSPPLADLAFAAVIRQPALIFILSSTESAAGGSPSAGAAPAAAAETTGMLRFGGGRAHPPRYDLAGLLPPPGSTATGQRAQAAAQLYDPAALPAGRLGPIGPSPDYDGTPALQFALHPGAALDPGRFSHRRSIVVPETAEGLSRLPLDARDLAVLAAGVVDLRIVDDAARQWPYLVAEGTDVEMVPLDATSPETRDRTSRYRLGLPVPILTFDRLQLEIDGTFVDRAYRLEAAIDDRERRTLASGHLARSNTDPRPLAVEVGAARVRSLTLQIEDGDDAPLVFRSITARVALPAVYLAAPAGRYEMLLGAADEAAPRYELERARAVVLAVRAGSVEAGPLEPNPRYSLGARWRGAGARQTLLLWGTLIAAVLVLGFMTLRLARREP